MARKRGRDGIHDRGEKNLKPPSVCWGKLVRDGVCSVSDEPLLEGTPVIPRGPPLGGQFYPLLYDPDDPTGT
jgi:hypothetical protein